MTHPERWHIPEISPHKYIEVGTGHVQNQKVDPVRYGAAREQHVG